MKPEFGYFPEEFEATMAWGARAIIKTSQFTGKREIDIPRDRQDFVRDENTVFYPKEDLIDWINRKVIPTIDKMVGDGAFRSSEEVFSMDSEDGRFHCSASSLNSGGGYVYIGCWENPF